MQEENIDTKVYKFTVSKGKLLFSGCHRHPVKQWQEMMKGRIRERIGKVGISRVNAQ